MGLALAQRGHLIERLIVFQRQNGQRHRKAEPVFGQQAGKHGTHLFEAQGHFTAFLLPRVGNDGEVRRVQLEPWRLRGCGGRETRERPGASLEAMKSGWDERGP